jgi:hypothetical protein
LSVFLFCDDREKSEKGNNFSFKKQRSIHSLSRALFKQTDFVEISQVVFVFGVARKLEEH